MLVGFVCFSDTPSCTGGSVVTGKGFHARQVGGERQGKEANIGPSGLLGDWAAG